jgi:hypothetical protein
MESNVITEPSAPDVSTVVEPRGHNDAPSANAHKEVEPDPKEGDGGAKKPESRMDAIKRAHADIEAKNGKTEEVKPDAEAKTELKPEAKAEVKESAPKADASEPEAKPSPKPSEGRKIIEAPVRFLPKAREVWNNVPHPVREEFDRVMRENETEIAQYREAKTFRDELADFENEAKSGGTTVKEALTNYVAMEKALRSDPAQGFRQLLTNMQLQPQQAISHILSAFNVTPQALAQHISQNPNEYTALASPRQQQFQQPQQPQQQEVSPEVKQLQEQLNAMRAEQVATSVIAPFRQEYPEYDQYEDQIAKVLQRGIIEELHGHGLSPRDKLEVALFMVAPHIRGGNSRQPDVSDSVPTQPSVNTPALDVRGNKSIKGAPSPGTDSSSRKRGSMSRTEALDAAWSELGLR